MRHYPGLNPVLDALRGQITVRRLRVMVEQLPADRRVSEAVGNTEWLDDQWLLHDISSQLRRLNAAIATIFRPKGSPEPTWEPLPTPRTDRGEPDEQQLQSESELDALIRRKQQGR